MKRIASIFFFSFMYLISHAQDVNFQWAKQMSPVGTGILYARGHAIALDDSGNVYTTGQFEGTVDFDPGPGNYNLSAFSEADIFISKLDAAGNFIWAKQMRGTYIATGLAIAIDASGNVYTTGVFGGTVDFDPGPGVFNLNNGNSSYCFLSKLNADGDFVWVKQLCEFSNARGTSIKVDVSGNIYTTGYFGGTGDFDPGPGIFNLIGAGQSDIFISKLSAAGNFVWAKQMSGVLTEECASIALDALGNIYTTGFFEDTVDFDPGPGVFNLNTTGGEVFISKLDGAGNFVWAKQIKGTIGGYGVSIAADASGNIYTAGIFMGTADFDPGQGIYNLIATDTVFDIFISKLNAAGNFIWAKQIGGSRQWCHSMSLDSFGNIYTVGEFTGITDFDPGPGIYNLMAAGHGIFVSKLNVDGNFIWAKDMGGTGSGAGFSIAVDIHRNIYTTGIFFGGTIDFDPGTAIYNLTSIGADDIFIHKMSDATAFNTYINTYTPVLAFEPCANKITVEDASTFNTGDTVLMIQMKGAVIDSTNTSGFGAITDYKNTGNYEFNYIKSKTGSIIELKNNLTRQYDIPNGKVQLVRVPYYQSINIISTLTCLPWDGSKGGVLVLNVQDTLELGADIDVSGKGFRGGAAILGQHECDIDSFYVISKNGTYGSAKGEGIFLNTRLLNGRGKAANGGGGGNSTNSGGAGGGNGGYGGAGGKEWVGCNNNFINGGVGGSSLNYDNTLNTIYLGGGGGAGQMNDVQLSGGGNGGGIAIIMTNYLKSNAYKIKSEGETPVHIIGSADDGRSGGGSGGTILVNYNHLIDNTTVSAKGGNGDNCIAIPDWYHGPGGGGGGGIIWINKPVNDPLLTTTISGGIPGTNINIGNNPWGATQGQNGNTLFNLSIPVANIPFVPGAISSFLTITICQGQGHAGYTTSGTYVDTLISIYGCDSIRTLVLTVNPKSYSTITQTICSGQTYSGYSVSGTYIDTLVAANGCDSVRTINLTVKSRSFSTITQSICNGQTYLGHSASGTYVDTLVAANGCDSIRTIHLTVQLVRQPYLGADTILCAGDTLKLYPGFFNTYNWQNGSTQSNITVKQGGLYSVTVTDNCHTARDEIMITENTCDVYFPSAFTPNNDGKNDWFKILGGYNLKEYHLVVFNRWGQKVFETYDTAKGWNGSFNGQLQQTATFVWYCEFNKPGNTDKTKMKGTITLIR